MALAVLHGINANAKKISLRKAQDGKVTVVAEYRDTVMPNPGTRIGEKVIEALRNVTHLEGDKGKTMLTVGVRDRSVELKLGLQQDKHGKTLSLKFPE